MNRMRDFSWQLFARTGNVQAYLLFKEAEATPAMEHTNRYSTFTLDQDDAEYALHQVEDTV